MINLLHLNTKNHKITPMKIYFYSCKKNINSFLLINEASKEAILIDPTDVIEHFIKKLENESYILKAVCITNSNIEEVKRGVKTWQSIYDFKLFEHSNLFGDVIESVKTFQLSSFNIEAFSVKKSAKEKFCMYKIENALFTGKSLLASILHSSFNDALIKDKLNNLDEHTIIFPFSGPPIALKTLKETHLKHTSTRNSSYIS